MLLVPMVITQIYAILMIIPKSNKNRSKIIIVIILYMGSVQNILQIKYLYRLGYQTKGYICPSESMTVRLLIQPSSKL